MDLKAREAAKQEQGMERLGMACGALILMVLAIMAIAAVIVVAFWIRSHIP